MSPDVRLDARGPTRERTDRPESERPYVVGGATVYELFHPVVTELVLSRIPGTYTGDAYVPDWDRDAWRLRERTGYDDFTLERWVRVD